MLFQLYSNHAAMQLVGWVLVFCGLILMNEIGRRTKTGGIIVFGQTFVMLFTAILVATDRSTSFLMRLFSSPMKSSDYTNGYILPMLLVGVIQSIVTVLASCVIAGITGTELKVAGLLLVILFSIPSALMFLSIGLIFGSLFNEKSAPGVCSVIISVGTFLGGIFFDAEGVGGPILKICKCLPFLYCTKVARSAIQMDFRWESFGKPLLIVSLTALVLVCLAILTFRSKMKADQ